MQEKEPNIPDSQCCKGSLVEVLKGWKCKSCNRYYSDREAIDLTKPKANAKGKKVAGSSRCPQCYALRGHKWNCPVVI